MIAKTGKKPAAKVANLGKHKDNRFVSRKDEPLSRLIMKAQAVQGIEDKMYSMRIRGPDKIT